MNTIKTFSNTVELKIKHIPNDRNIFEKGKMDIAETDLQELASALQVERCWTVNCSDL